MTVRAPALPPWLADWRPSRGFLLRCLAAAAIAAVLIVLWRAGALDPLKPDRLAETRRWAQSHFERAPVLVIFAYLGVYAALAGAGLPVALALSLLAGAVFGPVFGGATLVVASTLAALVGYALAKLVVLGFAPAQLRKNAGAARFMRLVKKDPFMVVLSARLMPLLPFNLVNLAAGLASTPVRPYALATLVGVIPTSFIFATLGSGLGDSFGDQASLMEAVRSPRVILPILALAILSLIATIVRLKRNVD